MWFIEQPETEESWVQRQARRDAEQARRIQLWLAALIRSFVGTTIAWGTFAWLIFGTVAEQRLGHVVCAAGIAGTVVTLVCAGGFFICASD